MNWAVHAFRAWVHEEGTGACVSMVMHSTAQQNTAQHSAMQHKAAQRSTEQLRGRDSKTGMVDNALI